MALRELSKVLDSAAQLTALRDNVSRCLLLGIDQIPYSAMNMRPDRHAGCRITAVVVTYQPDMDRLTEQVLSLLNQVHSIVFVDNGSEINISAWIMQWPQSRVRLVELKENKGIGCAQNIGIQSSRSLGATHVLLMDDDSVPAEGMVNELLKALVDLPCAGAVGPNYFDTRRMLEQSPFVRLKGLSIARIRCGWLESHVEVDHLIASGCLIPIDVIDKVGSMREDLFIDFIDIEWCLRARDRGYRLYGVCQAKLEHRLGENPVRFFGHDFVYHSPERHYYLIRNAILIYGLPWVSFRWKFASAWRLALKACFYIFVTSSGLKHLKFMATGFLHGIRGQNGVYLSNRGRVER